jgi:hypothetical protein
MTLDESTDWIDVAVNSIWWRALVKTVKIFQFHEGRGISLLDERLSVSQKCRSMSLQDYTKSFS